MRLKSIGMFLVGAFLASSSLAAAAPSSVFDVPLDTKTVILPATKNVAKTTLTCSYYPHFVVKQVDEGELDAAQLSVVPVSSAGSKPACQRANLQAEKVMNPDDWTGYFKGVKGDYVFFDAGDRVNGALGFAIFAAGDGKKLFEDSAVGDLHSVTLAGTTLTLRYQRAFAGPCSAPHDGSSCWAKIAAATGVNAASQPDCVGGYLKAKNEMAKGRCEADKTPTPACIAKALKELDAQRWNEAPSVIEYEAQTILAAGHATTTAQGAALTCHPTD